MVDSATRERLFRVSLREMLLLLTLVGIAIASLKFANEAWLTAIAAGTIGVCFVALVVAAIDRGPQQAFAMAFSLMAIGYWVLVINGGRTTPEAGNRNVELDTSTSRLPTSVVLQQVYKSLRQTRWIDPDTGQELVGYQSPEQSGRVLRSGAFGPGPYLSVLPKREEFMRIGHCWWSLLLGYLGGRLGRYVYGRRMSVHSLAAESP